MKMVGHCGPNEWRPFNRTIKLEGDAQPCSAVIELLRNLQVRNMEFARLRTDMLIDSRREVPAFGLQSDYWLAERSACGLL